MGDNPMGISATQMTLDHERQPSSPTIRVLAQELQSVLSGIANLSTDDARRVLVWQYLADAWAHSPQNDSLSLAAEQLTDEVVECEQGKSRCLSRSLDHLNMILEMTSGLVSIFNEKRRNHRCNETKGDTEEDPSIAIRWMFDTARCIESHDIYEYVNLFRTLCVQFEYRQQCERLDFATLTPECGKVVEAFMDGILGATHERETEFVRYWVYRNEDYQRVGNLTHPIHWSALGFTG
ncbi:unnamed protein product [Calicophoron daubneyi]|uniref:Uncharacterized protein n=1 Tax=Calicophoron daubneyi TaxID=300641 RepID=A0AAV2TNS0_CALDB